MILLEMNSETDVVMTATKRAHCILNAKYEKANIENYLNQQSTISPKDKSKLKS